MLWTLSSCLGLCITRMLLIHLRVWFWLPCLSFERKLAWQLWVPCHRKAWIIPFYPFGMLYWYMEYLVYLFICKLLLLFIYCGWYFWPLPFQGTELELQTLKKMSTEYAKVKELAIQGNFVTHFLFNGIVAEEITVSIVFVYQIRFLYFRLHEYCNLPSLLTSNCYWQVLNYPEPLFMSLIDNGKNES